MDVRLKYGRYVGELRDIPTPEAEQMIADGRAEDPRVESPDTDNNSKPKQKKR